MNLQIIILFAYILPLVACFCLRLLNLRSHGKIFKYRRSKKKKQLRVRCPNRKLGLEIGRSNRFGGVRFVHVFYERGYVVRKIIRLRRCACSKHSRPINIGIKSEASNRVQLFLVSQLHDKGRNAVLDCIVGLKYDRRVTIYHDQLDRWRSERGDEPPPRIEGRGGRNALVTCKNSLFDQIPAFLAFFAEYLHVRSLRSSAADRRHAKPRGKSAVLTLIASYRFLNRSLGAKRWTDNVPVIRYYPLRDIAFIFTFFPYFHLIYISIYTNKSLIVGFIS